MNYRSFLIFLVSITANVAYGKVVPNNNTGALVFIENNGQIKDQYGGSRTDIQYVLPTQCMNIFVGSGQLHYQFTRTDIKNMHLPGTRKEPAFPGDPSDARYEDPLAATISIYRLDVALVGASKAAKCVASEKQRYYENYYLPGCPEVGIRAYSYQKITYKEVYPDIDWVIYVNGTKLEHEFIVGEKGDLSQIQLKYSGYTSLKIDNEGSIVASTPMGNVVEKAPVCYTAGGVARGSAYKLDGDVLSYEVKGPKEAILIDPEISWGTYYGPDNSTSPLHSVKAFDTGSIYSCGLTWSGATGTIATVGAFQEVFGAGTDAYLVKFDSSGSRVWATYYGGSDADWATGVDCDQNGMVYMCGPTASTSGMATAGSQQPTYGGGLYDAFLVKFLPDGTRHWATYAGGMGPNIPGSVSCDIFGFVYLAGDTQEPTNISTPGSPQPVKSGGFDWYVIQYDTLGVRQWGTYHGGPGNEYYGNAATDGYSVYLTGWTNSVSGIASVFAHQPTLGGGNDIALVKFYNNGGLAWGTYYGGTNSERAGSVICDKFSDIYLFGSTESDNNISTPGSYQVARAGGTDDFLVKFDREVGVRMWGTYLGGALEEYADYSRLSTDDSANIYIIGSTASTSGVATDTAWQTVYGGGATDAFFAKFNRIGAMKWCSYYGGSGADDGRGCSFSGEAVYICGQTNSPDQIATPDGFIPVGGSGSTSFNQGYLAKFADPDTASIPVDTTTTKVNGADAYKSAHFNLFPNPNNGTFTLEGNLGTRNGIVEFTVTDISGKVIFRDKSAVHNGSMKESVVLTDGISPGIYFMKIRYPGIERTLTITKDQ